MEGCHLGHRVQEDSRKCHGATLAYHVDEAYMRERPLLRQSQRGRSGGRCFRNLEFLLERVRAAIHE